VFYSLVFKIKSYLRIRTWIPAGVYPVLDTGPSTGGQAGKTPMQEFDKIDDGSRIDQSAVIPFRIVNDTFEILLITSINSKKWIFPKGIIEKSQTAIEAAKQEAWEEAGVEGDILDILLGEYVYSKWGGICQVKVFPLHIKKVYNTWPEDDQRERCWVSFEKAIELIEKDELKKLLKVFKKKKKAILSCIL